MNAAPDSRTESSLPAPAAPASGDRAIALFRSRAELRKAHADLREEIERLDERLRHLEGTSQKAQGRLTALDTGPDAPARHVLLRHELRALQRIGRTMIAACVADAAREWDAREGSAHAAECNQRRFAARREAQSALRVEEGRFYDVRERLDALWQERLRYAAPWRFIRRRDVDRRIVAAEREAAAIEAALAIERTRVEELDAEPTPAFPGLSIAARRELNLVAIAAADELARRLAGSPLLSLAGRVARIAVPGENASPAECETLIEQAGAARARLHGTAPLAATLDRRIEMLRGRVRYGGEADTVPVPESVPAADDWPAEHEQGAPNVLLDDAWGLSGLLLR